MWVYCPNFRFREIVGDALMRWLQTQATNKYEIKIRKKERKEWHLRLQRGIFFQNNIHFETISLVSTISKLFRKLTTRVHCSNSSLRDSFYVFCKALSLWSSSSLKWNRALQARYSSSPKLFHTTKSELLRHWTSTHPNLQVWASSSSLKPQPTQTHTVKSISPSFRH